MKRHYVWYGFVVLFVLLATTQTQARIQPNPNIAENKGSKGIVFVNRDQLLKFANSRGGKVFTFKISKHDLAKLAASGPKGCGCALEEDFGGGWQCFKSCVAQWVGTAAVTICAGACIAAGTANPIAIAVCAACLGIGEWIVVYCAASCAYYSIQNVAPKTPLPPNLRHGQTRGGNSAKLRLNPTRSGSLR